MTNFFFMRWRLFASCVWALVVFGVGAGLAGVALAQAAQSEQGAQEATFDVFEFQIEGASLLPLPSLEGAVYPHLGEKKTIADIELAREALEKAFHAAGYLTVVVNIPQQKVENGMVLLAVTEAPVERLRVVGSRYFSLGLIKEGVPELAEGNVPNFPQMQKELAALNRSSDRRITPVLRPGKTPGTVEVDLKVQDKLPLHGSVEANNRNSQDNTPTRITASLRWDNLWERQHSLGLTLQTVPERPNESPVFSANYTWPLASGDFLAFYGVRSGSDVALSELNVLGKGVILGARYIKPLRGSEGFFHTATAGVDYKDFNQTIKLNGGGGFDTPIVYMPFTLGWEGSWSGEVRTTKLGFTYNFNVANIVSSEQQFADKRFKGRPGYSYLRTQATHTENFAGGWGATARSTWQLSGEPLISNEQFSVGGVDSVRGYLESAATGDTGIAATFEVNSPNFAKRWSESLNNAQLVAFVDGGAVRVIGATPGQIDSASLSGAGMGLRLKSTAGASIGLDWAYALKDSGATRQGDTRLYFKFGYEW